MEFIDYYKILNLEKTASADDVKKSYRKLARKLHPDLNPGDKDAQKKFQQINEANQVLSDPEKRKKYDEHGKDWEHADQFRRPEHAERSQDDFSGHHFSGDQQGDFSGFFESMFGGQGRGRTSSFKGQDYHSELNLKLTDAQDTHQQTLVVNGKNLRITIPAGVEHQQVIKLKGHGAPGLNGGPSGDLYITFMIEPHALFKRVGNDLSVNTTIDLYTALLGGETSIDTLNGKVKFKVKPENQPGTKVRLKGKGFPVYKKDGQFGDLYVTCDVTLPTHLTDQQKTLFGELSKLSSPPVST